MKALKYLLGAALAVYMAICAGLLLAQNILLYPGTSLPPHSTPGAWASYRQRGWIATPPGPVHETIVFFHGNDEQAWDEANVTAALLTARGARVIYPEYAGFDFRAGEHPSHDLVIAQAASLLAQVRHDFPGQPLIVAGNSLGAGIAAQVAASADPARVLLFVPWDRMSAVAQERYPFVPVRLLLAADHTDYDSCAGLAPLAARVTIIYAGLDTTIPPHHAVALANCLNLPEIARFFLPQSTHTGWAKGLSPAQWDSLLAIP